MNAKRRSSRSLSHLARCAPGWASAELHGASASVALAAIAGRTTLGGALGDLVGRSVFLQTRDQLSAALALIELDGIARRIVLCPPDLAIEDLPGILREAQIDAIVSDAPPERLPAGAPIVALTPLCGTASKPRPNRASEWVMFTSGTTGPPRMVAHSLEALTGAIASGRASEPGAVWATFYDIRRYGGLQILLRALLGGGSMVLSSAREAPADFLTRMAAHGATHVSGTPSHWRGALMSGAIGAISPRYVRLSGEIADQGILDALRTRFPDAGISHAYASTEAGVCFEVGDGREGVPAAVIDGAGPVEMRLTDGVLQVRSQRSASGYVGAGAGALRDAEEFIDTGDLLERRGERYHFIGRRGGVINVGGLKVHPEEIEAVINCHPAVRMSLVRARRSPITGAVVTAEVVVEETRGVSLADELARTKAEILAACRQRLAPFKVPAQLRFVAALPLTVGGKISRAHA